MEVTDDIVERIQRLHEEDSVSGKLAVTRDDIPISYEAITPEWLTAVLCAAVEGARVVSHQLSDISNGVANRRRIHLQYNDAGRAAGLPGTVFCKAGHGLGNRLLFGLSGAGAAEVDFYNHVRPLLELESSKSYFANIDRESHNLIIVLHDMRDVDFCQHDTLIDRAKASSMMQVMAALHGRFYDAERLARVSPYFQSWASFWDSTKRLGLEEYHNRGFESAESVIPKRLFRRAADVWEGAEKSALRHHELEPTFLHSDVHLKNWYIRGENSMGLTDWQGACTGHWSRDVSYALSTSLAIDDRRAWEQDLLREYLDALATFGGPKVSFDEAWLNYRQQMFTALVWWTNTLKTSPSQPKVLHPDDSCLHFIRRVAVAMDDLDSVDSI